MGLLDSCMFGSADDATDPALSSVVIDDGEGAGGGSGNGSSKDLLSASLAESGILNDAVGDGVVSLGADSRLVYVSSASGDSRTSVDLQMSIVASVSHLQVPHHIVAQCNVATGKS